MQTESIQLISLSVIVAGDNDRVFFEQQALVELAASIADVGLAEPIIIRPVQLCPKCSRAEYDSDGICDNCNGPLLKEWFQIVAGERRWRASGVYTQKVMSGEWPESSKCKPGYIQAIVRELNDEAAAGVMLAENIHRKDINPMEECRAYISRMERFGWSQERVAKEAKTNPTRVRNRIRLAQLADDIQELIAKGHFDLGWAEELVPLDHNRQRIVVAWIRDQKSYKPTRGQVTAQVSILLEQQSQEAMFDMNALFSPVAVEVAQDDKRVSDMLPDLGIPGLRIKTGKIGTIIDDYIALLIEQNRPLEARVIIHLWRHLMKSNFAQVYPWDSKVLPMLEKLK